MTILLRGFSALGSCDAHLRMRTCYAGFSGFQPHPQPHPIQGGFTDWDAACPDMEWPRMTVNSNGLYVDWGKQYCYIRHPWHCMHGHM